QRFIAKLHFATTQQRQTPARLTSTAPPREPNFLKELGTPAWQPGSLWVDGPGQATPGRRQPLGINQSDGEGYASSKSPGDEKVLETFEVKSQRKHCGSGNGGVFIGGA